MGSLAVVVSVVASVSGSVPALASFLLDGGGLWDRVARGPATSAGPAPSPRDDARGWFRVATLRTRRGDYDGAVDAYERELALAAPDATVLANEAEALMALGRLGEAIDRYREAAAVVERAPDERAHLRDRASVYFGLGVALDRDDRREAARAAIRRALSLDPGLGVLRLAMEREADVFFVPPGDVFYYLGLAREAEGRNGDAATAFHDYLNGGGRDHARFVTGAAPPRYAARARDHLARLAAARAAPAAARRWRVLHQATLVSEGPLVAPLVDAAWRLAGDFLDPCLSDVAAAPGELVGAPDSDEDVAMADGAGAAGAPAAQGVARDPTSRLWLDVGFDGLGRVVSVAVTRAAGPEPALAACIAAAVRARLRVSRPARAKPTRARIELVLAPAAPSGL